MATVKIKNTPRSAASPAATQPAETGHGARRKEGKSRRSPGPRSAARRPPDGARSEGDGHSIPDRLFANVSPRSIGGLSLFDYEGPVDADVVANFMSEGDTTLRAAQALRDAGFEVLQLTPYTINVAAPISTYERAFRSQVVAEELPTLKGAGVKGTATCFTAADSDRFGLIPTEGTAFETLIEGVAIEMPRYYFSALPLGPRKAYWHLDVPGGVSLACNADRAHRAGITGRGIRVAMVDSGQYAHPYFAARGYRVGSVTLAPGASNADQDENGHGTAESANIFANAPDCELLPVKMSFTNSLAAFNAAVALTPDVISCSWGSSLRSGPLSPADQALAASIADAVARGIVVVFSAGNGHWGFPGQHPDVISAGGVFLQPDGTLTASDYASGFVSNIYPNRNAPDLCGLVGMQPRAAYIMLPLQPGCEIDTGLAGGRHPNGDETEADDGWAAISGTSAAAPQLAGVAALLREAAPQLAPAELREVLMRTAVDVSSGRCNPASSGAPAGPGFDVATGAGLVDAHAAVLVAKLRGLGPGAEPRPDCGVQPIVPPQALPLRPLPGLDPAVALRRGFRRGQRPVVPMPAEPATSLLPALATARGPAAAPAASDGRSSGRTSGRSAGALTAEDIRALEDLVIQRRLDRLG